MGIISIFARVGHNNVRSNKFKHVKYMYKKKTRSLGSQITIIYVKSDIVVIFLYAEQLIFGVELYASYYMLNCGTK